MAPVEYTLTMTRPPGSSTKPVDGFSPAVAARRRSGCPLSAAAARAVLIQVLVPGAYAHTTRLGGQLADGVEEAIKAAGLPWTVIRFGPRSGQWYGPVPRTGAQAHALTDPLLTRLIRIWLANRGIWDVLPGAGPTVPVPATSADVTRYLEAYSELLAQLR